MRWNVRVVGTLVVASLFVTFSARNAVAGSHTWRINEVFSSADGSVQFIELAETCGTSGETFLAGHQVKSNSNTVNLASLPDNSSADKFLLLGTANLTSLGGPTPDYIIPANFFSLSGDLLQYTPYHSCTVSSGSVPTNGTNSLHRSGGCQAAACPGTVALNSPTNFAGQSGSVTAPACTDGDGDGYGSPGDPSCPNGSATDCNDANNAVHPGAVEDCDDTIDNNCDGDTDCDDATCAEDPACAPDIVPTVSQWGLLTMAVVLLAGGTVVLRRRFLSAV